ncbi:MAG TPA: M50 family metallopeptidase [Melioribacteraceae bacterium]|nr:M50 family metallopeptidase [Melioribacteraceae bacterium]
MNPKIKKNRAFELIILIAISIAAILLWDTFAVYPVKLLVVLFHEISHGFAAILSGGEAISLEIGADLSGECLISEGNPFLIASSGYLGSFIAGVILFYSAYNSRFRNFALSFLAAILILFTINKGTGQILPVLTALLVLILFFIIKFSPDIFSNYLLKSVGLISCLYVVVDIKEDIFSDSSSLSDAAILSGLTGIDSTVWGIIWLAICFVGIYLLFTYAFKTGSTK